jgi:hypothetical protein
MTWVNAERIAVGLRRRADWTGVKVKILATRMEGRRPAEGPNDPEMRCCRNESEFVKLSKEKLAKLRGIGEAAASGRTVMAQNNDLPARSPPSRGSADAIEKGKA